MMTSPNNTSKCHVLEVEPGSGVSSSCVDTGELALFTPQELDSMDFSKLMDVDDVLTDSFSAKGIQAENLSSLLEQFEATESSDSALFEFNAEIKTGIELDKENICNETCNGKSENIIKADSASIPSSKILDKIRAGHGNRRKLAIMLPIGTPIKKDGGQPTEKLHHIMQQKNTPKPDKLPLIDQNIQDVISDHDYCSNSSLNSKSDITCNTSTNTSDMNSDIDVVVAVSESSGSMNDSVDMTISQESKDSGVEEGEILETEQFEEVVENPVKQSVFFPSPHNLKSKRNYRKRKEPMVPDSSKYYDKIPAYFTTLSLPQKLPKKESVSNSGICLQDYLPRDRSPKRETDSMYNKLPDYYSCFTNSTKYDGQEEQMDIKLDPMDEGSNKSNSRLCSRQSSRSRSSSSSSSSSSCGSSYSSSSSRFSSRERSYDRYHRSLRRKRRKHSCSSSSQSSNRSRSSSCSSSYSSPNRSAHSRSRSYSTERVHSSRNKRVPRRYRSSRSSRSQSRSRPYRSRSRHRYSRHRSSYSRSSSRDRSLESRRLDRKKRREEEKKKQITERRIVYVGRIPDDFTKKDLHRRFDRFGDIVNVSTHFRESGDNYGFVTFAYTCDAYAAIEKGNAVTGEMKFDLCFGGRRQFCDTDYADLDGNAEEQDVFQSFQPKTSASDFDELLRQARQKIKK